ncbi:arsenate reductase (glutaredoxin) [Flavobacterium sp.]|uniref:arsenate reductase (glutaredoxin) n=1 Tax=Flavobacterium sp. TaxID=239 RepID=UPI00261E602A|nr:arsenate reductase (glutaredoxin) [Flavobacterium sp.]
MIQIYHNPRCSKSREGLEIVENSGQKFQVINYMKEPLNDETLKGVVKKLGIRPLDLIRVKEAAWKQFKDKTLADQQVIDAMLQHPELMERPIVVHGSQAVIGRPPQLIRDLLSK